MSLRRMLVWVAACAWSIGCSRTVPPPSQPIGDSSTIYTPEGGALEVQYVYAPMVARGIALGVHLENRGAAAEDVRVGLELDGFRLVEGNHQSWVTLSGGQRAKKSLWLHPESNGVVTATITTVLVSGPRAATVTSETLWFLADDAGTRPCTYRDQTCLRAGFEPALEEGFLDAVPGVNWY